MRDFKDRRYWLVGASEGLGRAVAEKLSAEGAELILSARKLEPLAKLAEELPGKAFGVAVDISDDDAVRKAAEQVGEVDGVILLAGVYWPMDAK